MSASCLKTNFTPAIGKLSGAPRSLNSTQRPTFLDDGGAFELQPNGHEVVRRPRPRIAERQLALVALGDLLHFLVERCGPIALDQKRRVHDHLVADGLVRPRSDGRLAQVLINVA